MSKEVMKLALETLEENHHLIEAYQRPEYLAQYDRVISAASKALAEQPAQQEPVYHLRQFGDVTKEQFDRYMATNDINQQLAQQEPKQSEIFCGVDFADGVLSVSILRRRADDVAELLHLEQIALPLAEQTEQRKLLGLEELKAFWNSQANNMNQWDELGLDEIVSFAQSVHGIKEST